ncbi:MAG: DUF6249 domain-containing protein [Parabacteroides sp.]
MIELGDTLIPLLAIFCSIGMPVFCGCLIAMNLIKRRYDERKALIERGMTLKDFEEEAKPNRYPALRKGLLLFGLALGAIAGTLLTYPLPICQENRKWLALFIPTFSVLCGGIGLIAYFFLSRHFLMKERKEDVEQF